MRKDMAKLIVERARKGGRYERSRRNGRTRPVEDADGNPLPLRIPLRRPEKTKVFNDYLAPLERYLDRQVGRPWNEIYSEITTNLRVKSTVQQHLRDHIKDIVAVQTRIEDGQVRTNEFGWDRALASDLRKLFVDPRTGLLARKPVPRGHRRASRERTKAYLTQRDARMREIGPMLQLHKLKDGTWWEVELEPVAERQRSRDVVIDAGMSSLPPEELYGRRGVFAATKRQLSRAALWSLGIR